MRTNHKVTAFTILETVITMMVSALIIGLALTAYVIVHRSYLAFEKKNEEIVSIVQLDKVMQRDLSRGHRITSTRSGIHIPGTNDTISYEFSSNFIVRIKQKTDTFKFEIQNFQCAFENKSVDLLAKDTMIDQVSFRLIYRKDTIPFVYHKYYSSQDLFK